MLTSLSYILWPSKKCICYWHEADVPCTLFRSHPSELKWIQVLSWVRIFMTNCVLNMSRKKTVVSSAKTPIVLIILKKIWNKYAIPYLWFISRTVKRSCICKKNKNMSACPPMLPKKRKGIIAILSPKIDQKCSTLHQPGLLFPFFVCLQEQLKR